MAVILMLSAPLATFPFRSCLLSVYLRWLRGVQSDSSTATPQQWIGTTIIGQVTVTVCAMFIPNVATPLSIVGAVAGSLIVFILPALFLLVPATPEPRTFGSFCWTCSRNIGPACLLVGGLLIGPSSLSLTLYHLVTGKDL